jgi:hypothetical protein
MSDTARADAGGEPSAGSVGRVGDPVPPPATTYRRVSGGRLFQTAVPSNWQAVTSNSAVKYVPQNAYGQANGQTIFTHGVELGVARASSRDLESATNSLLRALAQGNPDLRQTAQPRQTQVSGRTAIQNQLVNRTPDGGEERVGLVTTFLADGSLFYMLAIVPSDEVSRYQPAFSRVLSNLRLNDQQR